MVDVHSPGSLAQGALFCSAPGFHVIYFNNILLVAAAGNEGPDAGTVSVPGNSRYVLTVTGVNSKSQFPFFPSRGPISPANGDGYNKPDLAAVAGDINMPAPQASWLDSLIKPASLGAEPSDGNCIYAPGVIAPRSSSDPDQACSVKGNSKYRFMTGTSMATPMAAGIGADVIGYIRANGGSYKAVDVKAVMMETARDLSQPRDVQGSGIVDGDKLARTVVERVQAGLPVGNVAYVIAMRLLVGFIKAGLNHKGRYH